MEFKPMTKMLSEMKNHILTRTNKLNDFSRGSALRSLIEAVAIQIEEYSILMRENVKDAQEDALFSAFDMERKEATRAYGNVTVYFNNALPTQTIVPRGSRFYSNISGYSQMYETLSEYIIPKGSTSAQLIVYCTEVGEYGNIPAETISVMQSPIRNVSRVTNQEAFRTGTEQEPIEDMQSRFRDYILSIGRGTEDAVRFGIRSIEEVSGVRFKQSPGVVTAYVHDKNGDLPDAVRDKINNTLVDYKAAGIDVRVRPVEKTLVPVDVEVFVRDRSKANSTFKSKIESAINQFLDDREVADNLYISDLAYRIRRVDERLIYDVKFNDPTSDIETIDSEILRPGETTITVK